MKKVHVWLVSTAGMTGWLAFDVLSTLASFDVSLYDVLSSGWAGEADLLAFHLAVWFVLVVSGTWLVSNYRDELPAFGIANGGTWLFVNISYGMVAATGLLSIMFDIAWFAHVADVVPWDPRESNLLDRAPWVLAWSGALAVPISEALRRRFIARRA
ncbi:hypothetical protein SPF06_05255 [Sinomonas sp. JGH33]|uniref:Uncharacterized protein n=1 Tax=Sinomonas terricola TaxID=3110330 RepID=A0ABU5T388_9MICC|nr:hypothetical protein [Sinomonas sp. JGH33]MEA5454127.1 hypothetical protein [Sinomonas sp. JGH33]